MGGGGSTAAAAGGGGGGGVVVEKREEEGEFVVREAVRVEWEGAPIEVWVVGVGNRICVLLEEMLNRCRSAMLFHFTFEDLLILRLRGVCDESEAALQQYTTWDKPSLMLPNLCEWMQRDGTQVFRDLDEMLRAVENPERSWVLVGSMNALHCAHCVAAFRAGCNVFCEKPLCTSLDQAREMLQAQKDAGRHFATGFVLRHAPLYVWMHDRLQKEEHFGKLVSVEANELLGPSHGGYIMRNWRRFTKNAGPHILEKCCHDIDLMSWLIDSLPVRVAAFGGNMIFTPENRVHGERAKEEAGDPDLYTAWLHSWEDVDPFDAEKDIEDTMVCILEYRNGVKATFHTNACSPFARRRMCMYGLRGAMEADLREGEVRFSMLGQATPNLYRFGNTSIHGGGDVHIVMDLYQCMVTGKPPKASGPEGLQSAIVCLALDESRATGKPVDLQPIWEEFSM